MAPPIRRVSMSERNGGGVRDEEVGANTSFPWGRFGRFGSLLRSLLMMSKRGLGFLRAGVAPELNVCRLLFGTGNSIGCLTALSSTVGQVVVGSLLQTAGI